MRTALLKRRLLTALSLLLHGKIFKAIDYFLIVLWFHFNDKKIKEARNWLKQQLQKETD